MLNLQMKHGRNLANNAWDNEGHFKQIVNEI